MGRLHGLHPVTGKRILKENKSRQLQGSTTYPPPATAAVHLKDPKDFIPPMTADGSPYMTKKDADIYENMGIIKEGDRSGLLAKQHEILKTVAALPMESMDIL